MRHALSTRWAAPTEKKCHSIWCQIVIDSGEYLRLTFNASGTGFWITSEMKSRVGCDSLFLLLFAIRLSAQTAWDLLHPSTFVLFVLQMTVDAFITAATTKKTFCLFCMEKTWTIAVLDLPSAKTDGTETIFIVLLTVINGTESDTLLTTNSVLFTNSSEEEQSFLSLPGIVDGWVPAHAYHLHDLPKDFAARQRWQQRLTLTTHSFLWR